MKKYILLFIGGRQYRLEIDSDLDVELRKSLKDKYHFDENHYLSLNQDDLASNYQSQQLIYKSILNQISTYDLSPDMQMRLETLKSYVNPKKSSVYHSDLVQLENLLGEASEIYQSVRGSAPKKSESVKAKEPDEALEVKPTIPPIEDASLSSGLEPSKEIGADKDSGSDTLDEFKEVFHDMSSDDTFSNEVPAQEISERLDNIEVCSSVREYEEKTGYSASNYDAKKAVSRAIENNNKIILPPNANVEEVAAEVIRITCKDDALVEKVTEYVEQKGSYSTDISKSFEHLRSNLKVSGLNSRNLNYFGDQFIDQFMQICNESGTNFEDMFADYFNGYSASTKYNSALDKFIRQFITYNGGDENTRALLEAMIVKKAVSKHLISSKYNRYLNREYQDVEVSSNGYVRFNDQSINQVVTGGGVSETTTDYQTEYAGTNNFSSEATVSSGASAAARNSVNASIDTNTNVSGNLGANGTKPTGINTNVNPGRMPHSNLVNPPKGGIGVNPNSTFQANQDTNAQNRNQLNSSIPPKTNDATLMGSDNPALVGANLIPEAGASLAGGLVNDTGGVGGIIGAQSVQAAAANARKNRVRGAKGGVSKPGSAGPISGVPGHAKGAGSGRAFSTNNDLNPARYAELDDDSLGYPPSDLPEDEAMGGENPADTNPENPNIPGGAPNPNAQEGENPVSDLADEAGDAVKDAVKKTAKEGIKAWIATHKGLVIAIGAGAGIVLIILLILLSSGSNDKDQIGYVDRACNYNETKVTVTNCYRDVVDRKEIATLDLKEYILGSTYAYTYAGDYSDEVLKAIMVTLKTNAFSYGNYNSSTKNIEVKSCSIENNYCPLSGCKTTYEGFYSGVLTYMADVTGVVEETIPEIEDDYRERLARLYEEVSNYLYLSTSYRSAISSLSSRNALSFSQEKINEFVAAAANGEKFSTILDTVYQSEENEEEEEPILKDTFFIGDSRMKGIQNTGVINENNTVYGVGYGYDWFVGSGSYNEANTNAVSGAITGANAKMRNNVSYNIVIWLGVNDLQNVNSYYQKYYELATGEWNKHMIYVVSVGPVLDEKSVYAKNEAIDSFNAEMKSLISSSGLSNLQYIDLGYTEESITSYDSAGVHYGAEDYQKIYEIINGNFSSEISTKLTLYNLTDYCVYYNVTNNVSYWWPIGSKTATSGNIYAGTPVSVRITSTFGPRRDPIDGTYHSGGHGAIDIGTVRDTPIIATKSGTVNYTNEGCAEGNLSCGGGYGNYIKIDHGEGIESLYAHLNSVLVEKGDVVTQGQIIGYSGSTGRSTGPHLHFEIRLNGTRVDPLDYVSPENPRLTSITDANFNYTGNSSDSKNAICSTLLSSGYSNNAVIGIMINMNAESGFNPLNLQNDYEKKLGYNDATYTVAVDNGSYTNFVHDSAGYGIVQWTYYSRKEKLYNFAKSQGKSIGALDMQLEFFTQELKGYAETYKYVTGNYSASEIGLNFCLNYENPENASTNCPIRVKNNLEQFTNYVQSNCGEG